MQDKKYSINVQRISDDQFVVLIGDDHSNRIYKWPANEERFARFMVDMLGDYLYAPITSQVKEEIHARTLMLLRRLEQDHAGN